MTDLPVVKASPVLTRGHVEKRRRSRSVCRKPSSRRYAIQRWIPAAGRATSRPAAHGHVLSVRAVRHSEAGVQHRSGTNHTARRPRMTLTHGRRLATIAMLAFVATVYVLFATGGSLRFS